MKELKTNLKKAHILGQHCQRNWDLNQSIPQEDIDLIIHAAVQCPSKQNLDFYSLIAIQNREIIEKIYDHTETVVGRKNSQVLGQLLLIFTSNPKKVSLSDRNCESRNIHNLGRLYHYTKDQLDKNFHEDMHQAAGVAAGFVNVTASLLGYRTGCNRCFNDTEIKKILNLKNEKILLMMGIGIHDDSRNRREEHYEKVLIETYKKIPINITYL